MKKLRELFDSSRALVLAIAVHVALVAVVVVSLDWTPKPVAARPKVKPVQATVVDATKVEAEIERLKQAEQAKARKVKEAQEDLEKKARALERERKAEEQRLAKLREQRKAEERKAKKAEQERQAAIKRKREAEAKAKAAEEEKKRIAAAKKAAEEKRKRAAEKKRQAEEKRRREQAEAALAKELAGERAALDRQAERLRDRQLSEYIAQIVHTVERNWIRPKGAPQGLECTVRVEQLPGGEVIKATITKGSGNIAFDRSVEAAVLKSSPLPRPKDPALFARNLVFYFQPED